jgi:hypothetical protein
MFRRYQHHHSAALGFLLALALERHTLTFALLVFLAGLVAGRAWSYWTDLAKAIRDKLLVASKRETIHTTPQPVYTASRSGRRDDIPY